MVNVFTVHAGALGDTQEFTKLFTSDERDFYISSDFLNSSLKQRGKLSDITLMKAEIEANIETDTCVTVLESWLGIYEDDIATLSIKEVEILEELMKAMKKDDFIKDVKSLELDGTSLFELMFVNFVVEFLVRGR